MALLLSPAIAFAQLEMLPEPTRQRNEVESGDKLPAGAADGQAVASGEVSTARPALDTRLGLRTTLTYTDNGLLARKGAEQEEFRFELAPFVTAMANTARTQGFLSYSPRFVLRTIDGASNEVRQDLAAGGNIFLYEDRIGLRATANYFDTNASPFGLTNVDPALNATNRNTVQAYSLSPYARASFGSVADGEVRYRVGYVDQGNAFPTETSHRVSGLLASRPSTSRFAWLAVGTYATSTFNDGFDYDRTFATALAYYVFGPAARIGVGVNCASNSILRSSSGADSGCGPAASGELRTSPRTALYGYLADAYYGRTGVVRITHLTPGLFASLDYRQGVFDQNESVQTFVDPMLGFGGDGTAATANRAMLDALDARSAGFTQGTRSSLTFGTLISAIVEEQAVNARAGYSGPRLFATAGVYFRDQSTSDLNLARNLGSGVPGVRDLVQRGGDLNGGYRIEADRSLIGGLRLDHSTSDSLATTSRLVSFYGGYQATLTRRITGSLIYRRTTQEVEGTAAVDYVENALVATATYRF